MKNLTNTKAAEKVLDTFPSMNELMNSKEMKMLIKDGIMHPIAWHGFKDSQEWEGIAIAVQNLCVAVQDKPFDNGYQFPGNNEKGSAFVYPAYGDPIEITSLTVYKALLTIMFCSWMEIGVFSRDRDYHKNNKEKLDKQHEAYLNFKSSDGKIYNILD